MKCKDHQFEDAEKNRVEKESKPVPKVYCEVDGKEIDLTTGYEKGKKPKEKKNE